MTTALQQISIVSPGKTGWKGRGVVVLYAEECPELCYGTDDEPAECLWARRRRQSNMGSVVLGTHYRLLDRGEKVNRAISHNHRP